LFFPHLPPPCDDIVRLPLGKSIAIFYTLSFTNGFSFLDTFLCDRTRALRLKLVVSSSYSLVWMCRSCISFSDRFFLSRRRVELLFSPREVESLFLPRLSSSLCYGYVPFLSFPPPLRFLLPPFPSLSFLLISVLSPLQKGAIN